MDKISVIILTKNEEKNIIDCIESIKWVDEIIIIDDYSSDRTCDLVKSFKDQKILIYEKRLENDFSAQRNFGLSKASGEWVLFIDADERVTPALTGEIMAIINDPLNKNAGFYIKRTDVIWGKKLRYGEFKDIWLLRLGLKNKGEWRGKIHEKWNIKKKAGKLRNELIHYPHPNLEEFLNEINLYTDIRAEEIYQKKQKVRWWSVLFYPSFKFLLNYVCKLGFLDGIEGFITNALMSFHSFLVRGKLWLLWDKKRKY
ncbi:MAG: glycosyltransferase family 2 protein [Patescibacteria group bacterium]|nr:glycosyltransferase family 2 protein [Patescibacteria group bacterium]